MSPEPRDKRCSSKAAIADYDIGEVHRRALALRVPIGGRRAVGSIGRSLATLTQLVPDGRRVRPD